MYDSSVVSSSAEGAVPMVTVPEPVTTPVSLREADSAFNTKPGVKVIGPVSEPERLTNAFLAVSVLVTLPAKSTATPNKLTALVIEPSRAKVPLVEIAPNTRAVGVLPSTAALVASASSDTAFVPSALMLKRSADDAV